MNDAIIAAVSQLVDDAQAERRDPSHSDLEFVINRSALSKGDPNQNGQVVGKAKRVRSVLNWAIDNDPDAGEVFVAALIAMIKGRGGFRVGSPNFVGDDAVRDAIDAFMAEGYVLSSEGDLGPAAIDTLTGQDMTRALEAYVRRARRGSEDAALLVGTGKDLLEATAAHVIHQRYGCYPQQANFPTLLGQAFTAVGLDTGAAGGAQRQEPQSRLQRALYEAACAINALRNKQGTGHGRPWLPEVTDAEARAAVQTIGIVSGLLLAAAEQNR